MEMGTHVMFASESIEGIHLWGYSCDLVWAFCFFSCFYGCSESSWFFVFRGGGVSFLNL